MNLLAHPLYPLPTQEQYLADPEAVGAYIRVSQERIQLEREDPFRYGVFLESWVMAEEQLKYLEVTASKRKDRYRELLIMGGNRSAKSEYAGRKVHEVLASREDACVWCLAETEDNCIRLQQPIVWKYMPPEYKELKKGQVTNIQYTKKNGFSNGVFIYPNGSLCEFRNYAQDPKTIEGGECDLIWCDELVPLSVLETLRYRLATRGGILLVTFTPVQGWTETVKSYLQGASDVKRVPAPLLGGKETVPLVQQPVRKNSRIVYFHPDKNPFGGYENLVGILDGAPKSEILTRAYGVPTRAIVSLFPKFREDKHVIPATNLPAEGSRYMCIDPAAGRNWFMTWVLVDALGNHYVYREWPDEAAYGPWAEPDGRKHDGKRGPAQSSLGWGLKAYKEEIERLEGKEVILGRWLDSRFGNTPTQTDDGTVTLLDSCNELGLIVNPAPRDMIEEGVQIINDRLDFSKDEGPKLFVSEDCRATIFSLKEWTGADGKDGASKDPIDNLRYLLMLGLVDVEGVEGVSGGGAY